MKKNKITFLVLETILLVLALFFVLKIFDKNVPGEASGSHSLRIG